MIISWHILKSRLLIENICNRLQLYIENILLVHHYRTTHQQFYIYHHSGHDIKTLLLSLQNNYILFLLYNRYTHICLHYRTPQFQLWPCLHILLCKLTFFVHHQYIYIHDLLYSLCILIFNRYHIAHFQHGSNLHKWLCNLILSQQDPNKQILRQKYS